MSEQSNDDDRRATTGDAPDTTGDAPVAASSATGSGETGSGQTGSEQTGSEQTGSGQTGSVATAPVEAAAVSDAPASDVPAEAAAGERPAGESSALGGLLEPLRTSITASVVMLACGIIGLVASSALVLERIELALDPNYVPSCSINPILSCGTVMKTEQASFFGFTNTVLGLPAFAVIITTGVLALGRVKLPRWYWIGQTLATTLGFIFVNYLAFQSIYRINALCPYCMVVWTVTPIILVLSFRQALGRGRVSTALRDGAWVVLVVWYAIIILMAGERFWYYWKTLF